MATKTVTLNGAEQRVDELGGLNALIINNTTEVLYVSAKSGVVPYADGVIEIPPGEAQTLLDSNGTVFLLGSGGRAQLTGIVNFKQPSRRSGSGGGVTREEVSELDAAALDSAKEYTDSKAAALTKKITANTLDISTLEQRLITVRKYPQFTVKSASCYVGIGFTDGTWLNMENDKSSVGLAANLYNAVFRFSISFDIAAITKLGKTGSDIQYLYFYNLGTEFLSELSKFSLLDARASTEIYGRMGASDFARPTVIGYMESPAPTASITVGEESGESVFPLNVFSYTRHSLENGFYLNCSISKFYYTTSQTVTAKLFPAIASQPNYESASFMAMTAANLAAEDVCEYPPYDLPDEGDTDLDQTDF